jgi:hypothetical protein
MHYGIYRRGTQRGKIHCVLLLTFELLCVVFCETSFETNLNARVRWMFCSVEKCSMTGTRSKRQNKGVTLDSYHGVRDWKTRQLNRETGWSIEVGGRAEGSRRLYAGNVFKSYWIC